MTSATVESYTARLAETLPRVRGRIEGALGRAGRASDEVTLVGVTKGHPLAALEAAFQSGLTDLGENRVEEAEEKHNAFSELGVRWHFVGHIQSRKAKRAVAIADVIHSVSSMKLGRKISGAAEERGEPAEVLVQVNASGEEAKGGLEGGGVVEEIHAIAELPGVHVLGLMTMAPLVTDERLLAGTFAALRKTSEDVRAVTDRVGSELSMGMTNDFEIAIREGSTMVRIGTALFGERDRA
ncbi:MAG: YggS family pyridoxal phosphate-dependent enzyme [Gemmatimonadota bacterium]|nr:YggS family pyridoxal phosphate-dependent enzyme [Gemmatimonadota bacterium]